MDVSKRRRRNGKNNNNFNNNNNNNNSDADDDDEEEEKQTNNCSKDNQVSTDDEEEEENDDDDDGDDEDDERTRRVAADGAMSAAHHHHHHHHQRQASSSSNLLSPEMDFMEFDFDESNASGGDAQSDTSSDGESNSPPPPAPPPPHMDRSGAGDVFAANASCSTKNDLGGSSSPFVRNCFVHSLSFQNLRSSPKYHNDCCSTRSSALNATALQLNGLDDRILSTPSSVVESVDNEVFDSANVAACGQRLLRRESSLFNIRNEALFSHEDYNLQSALLSSFASKPTPSKYSSFLPSESLSTCGGCDIKKECAVCSNNLDNLVEKTMIWSEMEACTRQVTQIGASACGATAVINVLTALNLSYDKKLVEGHIHTRFRAEMAPVAHYLLSRSVAGTTHEDLIQGMSEITGGAVYGRFFHMYPARDFNLLQWLKSWIAKGAVPIATLNLQRGLASGQSIPDAWHHQMVFGVGPKGVYLTNPLECVSVRQIQQQTCSESVLMVRRNDVISRWDGDCDLSPLAVQDSRWHQLNVLGQVINVLREATCPWIPGHRRYLTSHVKIPAAYKSGVTLFMCRDNELIEELEDCAELTIAKDGK